MGMGRSKLHNRHLPPRMVFRHGAYYHTPRVDGKQLMVRLSGDFAAAISMYHAREWRTLDGTTVNDGLSRFELEVLPGLAQNTRKGYRLNIGNLRVTFGDCQLRGGVVRSDVARYLDKRSAKVMGNREIAVLSSMFQSCIRWGWCDDNPCRGAPRNRERPRRRLPSEDELAALRVAAGEQMRCMIDLVLLIGLRKGDMLKIRLADCHPESKGVRIEVQKTGAVAIFEWSEALREVIDRARSLPRRVSSLCLFASPRTGQAYKSSGFNSMWRRTLRRSGVKDLAPHDLRRWAINEALRKGGLDYAQAIGVHQSRQSTELYLVPGEVVVRPLR